LQAVRERAHGLRPHFNIRRKVEQQLRFSRARSDVHGSRGAQVVRQTQHIDGGKLGIELGAFVAAAAVDHQDFQPVAITGALQRFNGSAQGRSLVVPNQNGRHSRGLWFLLDALRLLGGLDAFAGGIDLRIRWT
jgi:hypothetical protein